MPLHVLTAIRKRGRLEQPQSLRVKQVVGTRLQRRERALTGAAVKAAIQADIQAHWKDADELANRLAAKYQKKPGWMRARLTRHGNTKYGRVQRAINAWNAFLHFHSKKVNIGMCHMSK